MNKGEDVIAMHLFLALYHSDQAKASQLNMIRAYHSDLSDRLRLEGTRIAAREAESEGDE